MFTANFYTPSTVCQYSTLHRLLVLCLYVQCCLLQSVQCLSAPRTVPPEVLFHYVHRYLLQNVHCLSIPHTVPSVGSVSLCPLFPSTFCPLSVSTSHCTVCWPCFSMSTVAFYSLSTVCQYLTLYRLLALCHYVHCCLLQSVHCLSVPHTPYADCPQTALYHAALTPPIASLRPLW